MKLVHSKDTVYRFSEKNYRKLFRTMVCTGNWDFSLGEFVGYINQHVTDMTPEEAHEVLVNLRQEDREVRAASKAARATKRPT
jgi:hypothetical protein